jgi:hypothetical protein
LSAPSFVAHAGPRAAAWIRDRGLAPGDIACIPAAAGGPKGLALIPLDKLLFGDWLRDARPELIGASIGAWRMFAAAQTDPVAALQRLADGYVVQTYPKQPTPACVSDECRKLAQATLGGARMPALRPGVAVGVIASRAQGALAGDRGWPTRSAACGWRRTCSASCSPPAMRASPKPASTTLACTGCR